MPGGEDGDEALAASVADYETAPPGTRLWIRGTGWVDRESLRTALAQVRPEDKP